MRTLSAILCVVLLSGCGPSYSMLLATYNGEREELERLQKELSAIESEYAKEQDKGVRLAKDRMNQQADMASLETKLEYAAFGEIEPERIARIGRNNKAEYDNVAIVLRIFGAENDADLAVNEQWQRELETRPARQPPLPVVVHDAECSSGWISIRDGPSIISK